MAAVSDSVFASDAMQSRYRKEENLYMHTVLDESILLLRCALDCFALLTKTGEGIAKQWVEVESFRFNQENAERFYNNSSLLIPNS